MKRCVLVVAVALAMGGVGVTAPASAAPVPATVLALNGSSFWVRLPQCSGNVRTVLMTDQARPGSVTVTYIPSRFTRSCRFHVWAGWGLMLPDQIKVPMVSGPRGGPTVTKTYRTGPGLVTMAFGNRQSMPPSAASYYVIVP